MKQGSHFVFIVLCFIVCCGTAQDRYTGKTFATRSVVMARNGMVATSQPLATVAALDILKKGGTAIDAAIAANAVLGVTEPAMNGIGGDLFAIVYDEKTKKLYGLNSSGKSPYGLSLDDFRKKGFEFVNTYGPWALTVPGCVDGWFELHKKFGKIPMPQLLAPAIDYARNGFPIANEPSVDLRELEKRLITSPIYDFDFKSTRDLYLPEGKALKEGEIFSNPDLATTLEKIAKGGRDVFYRGEIARRIETYMKRVGGYLAYRDFAEHVAEWVEPLSTTYRGYTVWELPPNGQGITVLQMLNILENFDFSSIDYGSAEHLHLLAEAAKLAYTDRARFYADPQFAKIPTAELISKEYAKARSSQIKRDQASFNFISGDTLLKSGETTYLTVADQYGNMISMIQSNYQAFGSRMVPDGLGFALQNRGASFSLRDGENNTYAPHKRPFHTIIPAFVTKDDQPFMSFGVMGGSFQPMGHVQVLMNVIDFGMNIQEAGDAPRMHIDGTAHPDGTKKSKEFIILEAGFPQQTIRDLINLGHTDIRHNVGGMGGYQGIQYDAKNKVYRGASDPRKDGMAAGY